MATNTNLGAKPKSAESALQTFFEQDAKRLESLERTTGFLIKGAFLAAVVVMLLVSGTVFYQVRNIQALQVSAEQRIELNRLSLLAGLYSVREVSEEAISTRASRLTSFMIKGKRVILERNPGTDLRDSEINRLLRRNFELAEQYEMSPWIFMAFAAVESDFTKGAVSSAGAQGIVQFMPSTIAMVLGDAYRPGIAHDPIVAVEAWYKYISYLSAGTGGDLKWTAAAYMTPTAIRWKNEGRTITDFMIWVTSWSANQVNYPFNIEKLVHQYTNL